MGGGVDGRGAGHLEALDELSTPHVRAPERERALPEPSDHQPLGRHDDQPGGDPGGEPDDRHEEEEQDEAYGLRSDMS